MLFSKAWGIRQPQMHATCQSFSLPSLRFLYKLCQEARNITMVRSYLYTSPIAVWDSCRYIRQLIKHLRDSWSTIHTAFWFWCDCSIRKCVLTWTYVREGIKNWGRVEESWISLLNWFSRLFGVCLEEFPKRSTGDHGEKRRPWWRLNEIHLLTWFTNIVTSSWISMHNEWIEYTGSNFALFSSSQRSVSLYYYYITDGIYPPWCIFAKHLTDVKKL